MTQDHTIPSKSEILARHEFFRDLPPAIVDRLASHARRKSYAAGERIFSKGDDGHGLLAVLVGAVKISVVGEDGREIVLNMIPQNEIFGEIALLDGKPRTADATALSPCEVAVLDRRDFLALLPDHPPMAVKLLEIVSGRLRRTTEQVEDLSFGTIPARLAKALLALAELQGAGDEGRPRIQVTQKALGSTIGLSRETTNRHLREWEQAGYVTLAKGLCIINRPDDIARFGAN